MVNQTGLGWALELMLLLQPLRGSGRQISVTSTPTLFYIRSFRPASQGHTVRLCFKKKGRKGEREGKREGGKKGVRKPSGFSRSRSISHYGSCRLFPGTTWRACPPCPAAAAVGHLYPLHPPFPWAPHQERSAQLCTVSFSSFWINASHASHHRYTDVSAFLASMEGEGTYKDIFCGAPHPRDS